MAGRSRRRLSVQKHVTINGTIQAHCFDINEEGMYIHTDAEFKTRDIISLAFGIDGKTFDLRASIRHVEPEFGFGVKFLNVSLADKSSLRRMVQSGYPSAGRLKTALVADGDEKTRAIFRNRLAHNGFSVSEAANGREAIEVLKTAKPKVVVLDLQISGIGALKIIQFMKAKPELKDIPILVVATQFLEQETENVLRLGVNDYFIKATTPAIIFFKKIRRLVGPDLF